MNKAMLSEFNMIMERFGSQEIVETSGERYQICTNLYSEPMDIIHDRLITL